MLLKSISERFRCYALPVACDQRLASECDAEADTNCCDGPGPGIKGKNADMLNQSDPDERPKRLQSLNEMDTAGDERHAMKIKALEVYDPNCTSY